MNDIDPTVSAVLSSGLEQDLAWKAIRRRIAERYCRVVAVIDDEIDSPSFLTDGEEKREVSPRFWQLRKDFQNRQILCHLHPYEVNEISATDPAAAEHLTSAQSIAQKADIVILDWHLGMKEGSEHAEAILTDLSSTSSLRFVIINSNEESSTILTRLKTYFGDKIQDASQDAESGLVRARLGQAVFLLIRQKQATSVTPESDATDLIDKIFSWMETRFPDHLHLAGLELAARISELLPGILGLLPKSTDVPLFHQWLFNEDGETNRQIVSLFLEEIGLCLDINPLETLSDDLIKVRITERMKSLVAGSFIDKEVAKVLWPKGYENIKKSFDSHNNKTEEEKEAKGPSETTAILINLPKTWDESCIQKERLKPRADLTAHFPGAAKEPHIRSSIHLESAFDVKGPPFVALSALYESALSSLGQPSRLFPGCVLSKQVGNSDESDPKWLLCVTPACDCRWEKGTAFLFLAGHSEDSASASHEKITTCVTILNSGPATIIWDPKDVVLKPKGSDGALVNGYILVGAVRPMHAAKILQHTWNRQSRIGVDVPEFTRASRKGSD